MVRGVTDSDKRRLIERALTEAKVAGLLAVVEAARSQGKAWTAIARDVTDRTGVQVSHETLRLWFPGWAADSEPVDQ
jgi:hypothetical protein